MKDFTLSSMTQSFASISSLPRDVSCEDLDSGADTTVTEEYHVEVLKFSLLVWLHPANIIILTIKTNHYLLQIEKPSKVKSGGRFCLDSIKLQEIESLTAGSDSPAGPPGQDPLMLADIAEVSENSSLHIEQYLEEVDPVAKMLSERTDKLLEKKRKKRTGAKLELEDDIRTEARSARRTAVPERAKYCSETEMREKTESVLMRKFAWVVEEKKLGDDQSTPIISTEEIDNTSEDIDIIHLDAKLMKPSEIECRDQLKKIYVVAGSGSQMVDTKTNDQIKSDPDNTNTTETNGEEKEKIQTQSSDDRKIIDDPASDKGKEIEVLLSFLTFPWILVLVTNLLGN